MASSSCANAPTPQICTICSKLVSDDKKRAKAELSCGHDFHLDCIGSLFNRNKGKMRCPNCRVTEKGRWLIPKPGEDNSPPRCNVIRPEVVQSRPQNRSEDTTQDFDARESSTELRVGNGSAENQQEGSTHENSGQNRTSQV